MGQVDVPNNISVDAYDQANDLESDAYSMDH